MPARTAKHYRNMLASNPAASVGVTLAGRMVYAARHGAADEPDERLADIVRDLKRRYDEVLTPDECRREMDSRVTPTRPYEATECTCLRCGHTWLVTRDQLPRTCARCRSPYWDRPRQAGAKRP